MKTKNEFLRAKTLDQFFYNRVLDKVLYARKNQIIIIKCKMFTLMY